MIIYDAGALVAAESNARTVWALHDAALRRSLTPVVTSDGRDLRALAGSVGWSITLHEL